MQVQVVNGPMVGAPLGRPINIVRGMRFGGILLLFIGAAILIARGAAIAANAYEGAFAIAALAPGIVIFMIGMSLLCMSSRQQRMLAQNPGMQPGMQGIAMQPIAYQPQPYGQAGVYQPQPVAQATPYQPQPVQPMNYSAQPSTGNYAGGNYDGGNYGNYNASNYK
eukprot:c5939_g1_i1.p2 GENE.c5939_g1_i1~~c5939_g1_i1.p2  ORF type:complete len:166 (+),score=14.60 c5939_g1_i1:42-539(+)